MKIKDVIPSGELGQPTPPLAGFKDVIPTIFSIETSTLSDSLLTYDESGYTYDEAGETYDGLTGSSGKVPFGVLVSSITPKIRSVHDS